MCPTHMPIGRSSAYIPSATLSGREAGVKIGDLRTLGGLSQLGLELVADFEIFERLC